jgi:hypothetical protein
MYCALELSKNSWLLAIQFRDREQPSLYPIEGGNAGNGFPVDTFRENRFENGFAWLVVSNHCSSPNLFASPALASEQELKRADEDISRKMPGAALECQIAPCHD